MNIKEKNGVKYCSFENIENLGFVNHGFSTRIGGVSKGVFESLNVGKTRGDNIKDVEENIRRIADAIGFDEKNIVCGKQVHENKILKVTKENIHTENIEGYDGYITNEKGIVLTTFHADCVPIFLADKETKAVAMVHSGWRGTSKRICQKAVKAMENEYGTKAENISAAIGPSIGMCCFQVDMPVIEEFRKTVDFVDDYYKTDENAPGHFKMDLWGINKRLLEEAEVKDIEVTDICTMCRDDLFFSHRKMGNARGTMAAYISIK